MNWLKHFDERQTKEIKFSNLYAKDFSHGTDGHNSKLIIAKMAILLSEVESTLLSNSGVNKLYNLNRILRISDEDQEG